MRPDRRRLRLRGRARRAARRPPSALRARARSPSRSDAGRALDELYPHHRVAADARGARPRPPRRRRRGDRRLPARRRRAGRRRAARARREGRRPQRRLPPARPSTVYERLVRRRTRAPELLGEAVYGLPELHRDAIASADLVANPGCFPTAALLALAPLARAGLIADVVDRRQDAASRGAGRAPTRHHALRLGRRERHALRGRRAPPHAGDRPGARGARRAGARRPSSPHLLPLDQGELVSCYVTPPEPVDQAALDALYAAAYAAEPFVERRRPRRPACATCATRTICRIHVARRRAHAARCSSSPRSTTSGRARSSQAVQNLNLMFGRPETEGLVVSAGRPRASSRSRWVERARRACARSPAAALPAGFRAAGVAAGIKPSGGTDVGLLVCDAPRDDERRALHALGRARRAGARSRASAARLDALRAVVVNSGNANAATGGARPARTRRRCRAPRRWPPASPRTRSPSARPA